MGLYYFLDGNCLIDIEIFALIIEKQIEVYLPSMEEESYFLNKDGTKASFDSFSFHKFHQELVAFCGHRNHPSMHVNFDYKSYFHF